jgi:hypothetical protein
MNFEEKLALAIEFNKRVVAGQKVGQIATSELIRADSISVEGMKELVSLYPTFEVGKAYVVGELIEYDNELYQVIQAHTSQADWTPDVVPALFKAKTVSVVIPDFVQPTGSHDAYNTGDKVLFEGSVYESLIDANTWSPTTYPQGWKLI